VGRLVAAKRHYDILAWLEAWHEKYQKDFVYIIIGDGPERENLARFIYTLKIADKIILTWNVRNVFSYLSQSDVFLFASEYEWFPNVLLESSAVWIPIITTDFSTWARERMLGKYDDKNLMYPFKTFLWYILSPNIVVTEFVDCLEAVENMTIPDADLTQHTPESVITQLENIILNP
jgi:glycosyltransferase involved in cell wall biosynthesis